MAIHVKDEETDMLVRQLAQMRGIGITAAIKEAAREAIAVDLEQATRQNEVPLQERLKPLLQRLDKLPRSETKADKRYFDKLWGEEDG